MKDDSKINCCLNCDKRHVGCHSECKEYIEQRKAHDKYLEEQFKKKQSFGSVKKRKFEY